MASGPCNQLPIYGTPETQGYVGQAPAIIGSPVTYNFPNQGYPAQAPIVLANYGPSIPQSLNYPTALEDPLYDQPAYSAYYKALEPDTKASVSKITANRPAPLKSYEAAQGSITL